MTITFIDDDLASSTGQPWVAVVLRITGSRAAAIVLVIVMILMVSALSFGPAALVCITMLTLRLKRYFFCAVNQVATSSRQVFAFAGDKDLPFHAFLSKVNRAGVPANSVYVTLCFTCTIALIIIVSTTAFNIISSVSATGLFTSYFAVIGTVLARKLRRQPFSPSMFEVPRGSGIAVNVLALCFLSVAFVFHFFRAAPHPDAAGMNWGILIYGVAVLFSVS